MSDQAGSISKASDPVLEKIKDLRMKGAQAYENGEVKLFHAFPLNTPDRFNVSIVIEGLLGHQFARQVRDAARNLGLKFILAGTDYPLHSTMRDGLWEGTSIENRDLVFAAVQKEIGSGLSKFPPPRMEFTDLVLDASGNLLLMSKRMPDEVLRLRTYLDLVCGRHGLKPLPLDNMFHCTLLRLRDVPENAPDSLQAYRDEIVKIGRDMAEVDFTDCHYYHGSAQTLLNTKPTSW